MLEDSAVCALLTRRSLLDRLPVLPARLAAGARLLDLDELALWGPAPAAALQTVRMSPDSAAYAIYTSGSTGLPKGVVTPHRGIVNTLLWMQQTYRLGAADRVVLKTPLGFDVSLWEIFWPLLAGARIVVAPPGVHRQPAQLADLVRAREITLLTFVPSLLQVFLEQPGLAVACRSVRRVLVIGEALGFELKERFFERLPDAELHNLYGPTEASVHVTHHACERGGSRHGVPIGRPIANSSIFLLDRQLNHVPAGVAGEIFIGGSGLARGYLGRPGLTAQRFIGHRAAGLGGRLYRTGDLARRLPDGRVEYLGRLDFQVKVRGVRVELGDVEANLDRHPAVRASVVVAREHMAGGLYLTAYVVPAGERHPSPAELRTALQAALPDSMVPDFFMILAELPLNAAGKVDRRALPAPEAVRERTREPIVLPRDLDELRVANLWQELLGVHPIGVNENFFDLGGHSLLAVRLMTRIERLFGHGLPLSALFTGATVAAIAQALRERADGGRGAAADSPLVEIQPGDGTRPPLFLVHPAGGNLLCYLPLVHCLGREQRVFGLQDPAVFQTGELRFEVGEMAALYCEVLRAAQPQGPYQVGGWSMGGMVAQEMARQLEAEGEEVGLLALLDPSAARREGGGPVSEEVLLLWFATQLRVAVDAGKLAALPPPRRFPFVLAQCQTEGRLPADLEPSQARRIFDLYAAELNALEHHSPLPCRAPTLLCRAAAEVAGEPATAGEDASLGWRHLTGGLEIVVLPGTHQTLLEEPHVRALALCIRGRLSGDTGKAPATPADTSR
jgi:amino acid adenylation domain-containing protein